MTQCSGEALRGWFPSGSCMKAEGFLDPCQGCSTHDACKANAFAREPYRDQLVRCRSSAQCRTSASAEGASPDLCPKGPNTSATPETRLSRLRDGGGVAVLQQELASIEEQLAQTRHRPHRRSRQHAPSGEGLSAVPSAPGAPLLQQAMHLHDTITHLLSLVPSATEQRRASFAPATAEAPAHSAASPKQRGALTSGETADLAKLKLLTAQHSPAQLLAHSPILHADSPSEEALRSPDGCADENVAQAANFQAVTPPPKSKAAATAAAEADGHSRASAQPAEGGAGTEGVLQIVDAAVCDLRVPYDAIADLQQGRDLHIWLMGRVPGGHAMPAATALGVLGSHELRRTPDGSFCVSHAAAESTCQVRCLPARWGVHRLSEHLGELHAVRLPQTKACAGVIRRCC